MAAQEAQIAPVGVGIQERLCSSQAKEQVQESVEAENQTGTQAGPESRIPRDDSDCDRG